jgi:hypothetical protein
LSGRTWERIIQYEMTREPSDEEQPDQPEEKGRPGGNAAERLRQFLAERFGDEAPPIPPDEALEEETTESPTSQPTEDASAHPGGEDTREP